MPRAPRTLASLPARRARIRRLVGLGKRVGYLCFLAAFVLFFVGFGWKFTPALTGVIIALMVLGCFVLPPAIVFGYGLRAAEREEREQRAERDARARQTPRATARQGADGGRRPAEQRPDQG
jgi:hypothetical protein